MKKNKKIESKATNIFEELGFENPEEWLAKAELARQINNLIEQKDVTQIEAAKLLDIDQPKISALRTGKLAGFSLERLFRFLNILGQNITIKITPRSYEKNQAGVSVVLTRKNKKSIINHTDIVQNTKSIHAKNRK